MAVRSILRTGGWQPLHRGVYATYPGQLRRSSAMWAALLRAGPGRGRSATSPQPNSTSWSARAARPPPRSSTSPCRASGMSARSPGWCCTGGPTSASLRHPAAQPPRTRIEETALDLALGARTLDGAMAWLARACGNRLTTPARLEVALAGRPRARWRRELAAALADVGAGSPLPAGTEVPARRRAAARAARRAAPGEGEAGVAERLPGRAVRAVRGGGRDRRGRRAPAGGPVAGPGTGQRGRGRWHRHLALWVGGHHPAPLLGGGRGRRPSCAAEAGVARSGPAGRDAPPSAPVTGSLPAAW